MSDPKEENVSVLKVGELLTEPGAKVVPQEEMIINELAVHAEDGKTNLLRYTVKIVRIGSRWTIVTRKEYQERERSVRAEAERVNTEGRDGVTQDLQFEFEREAQESGASPFIVDE
ncbi:MAG: hypothetical protein Q9220_007030 [cf. Caloplaca sp. 1 TL-2023]